MFVYMSWLIPKEMPASQYKETLDEFGYDNWELVSVSEGVAYFKKEISAGSPIPII